MSRGLRRGLGRVVGLKVAVGCCAVVMCCGFGQPVWAGQVGGAGAKNVARTAATSGSGADVLAGASARIDELSRQGLETATLLGLATLGERQLVALAANDAIGKLRAAEVTLSDRAIKLQSTDPAGANRIRTRELAVALPILRARAQTLVGVASQDPSRLSAVIDSLEQIDPIAVGPAALRRVTLSIAMYHRAVLLGSVPGDGNSDANKALELLRSMRDWPIGEDVNAQVPPALAAEAWFALIRVATHVTGNSQIALRAAEQESKPPFVTSATGQVAEPGLFVRHAQIRSSALAMLWISGKDGAGTASFADVIAPIRQTVTGPRLGLTDTLAQGARDELIGRVAARMLDSNVGIDRIPTDALVHAGVVLSRDIVSRANALAATDAALARRDLGALEPEALVASAAALSLSGEANEGVLAIERLNKAIAKGLTEPKRSAILAALPGLADRAVKAAEQVSPASMALVKQAGDARLEALRIAGRSALGSAGPMTSDRARVIVQAAQQELKNTFEFDAAVLGRVLESLGKLDLRVNKDDVHMLAKDLAAAAIDQTITAARQKLLDVPSAENAGGLARVSQMGVEWFSNVVLDSGKVWACKVGLAESLAFSGDAKAVELYRELLAIEPPPERPSVLTIGLARALRRSGDAPGAFVTYRSLVEILGGLSSSSEEFAREKGEFFVAWAEMLQILAADNASGHRTGQIRLNIARLRAIDREFGTTSAKEAILAVERAIGRGN